MKFSKPISCHCTTCGEDFTKARRRGSMTMCPRCANAANVRRWKAANPLRKRALNQRWAEANREKARASKAKWQKARPAEGAAKTMRYYAAKLKRTPPWADHRAINAFYEMAARATRCTGIRFEVDHIVPLQGKTVSGLHVENNLRVLPKIANARKGNRFAEAA